MVNTSKKKKKQPPAKSRRSPKQKRRGDDEKKATHRKPTSTTPSPRKAKGKKLLETTSPSQRKASSTTDHPRRKTKTGGSPRAKKAKQRAVKQKSPTSIANAPGGMKTPSSKKKVGNKKQTPPSTSTSKESETSIVRDRVARNLNLGGSELCTPKSRKKKPPTKEKLASKKSHTKKSPSSDTSTKKAPSEKATAAINVNSPLQAHAIKWTSKRNVKMAVLSNCTEYCEDDVKNDTYEDLLMKLTSSFTPKQLGNAFAGVCIQKRIDFESVDMDTVFATKKNAQKLFIEVCMKGRDGEVVEIDSEEDDVGCSKELKKGKM